MKSKFDTLFAEAAPNVPSGDRPADTLEAALRQCGFDAQTWKGERVYLDGYGPSVRAYLTRPPRPGARPCDGASLVVTSFWKSNKSGLHAKGVKHAILTDLYTAGLISERPPERWQDVPLDPSLGAKRVIRVFEARDDHDMPSAHDQVV